MFVRKAAAWFAANPRGATYTEGDIEPGCWFALRWGMGKDCVLLLRLDDMFMPTVYGQTMPEPPEMP